mmetsp:Transcript_4974/g.15852  ORF Transcript_4974/g.15852 Transcript_4974/m.15852 type:complete len:227 (+) Transcript_4974:1307-1987(+)
MATARSYGSTRRALTGRISTPPSPTCPSTRAHARRSLCWPATPTAVACGALWRSSASWRWAALSATLSYWMCARSRPGMVAVRRRRPKAPSGQQKRCVCAVAPSVPSGALPQGPTQMRTSISRQRSAPFRTSAIACLASLRPRTGTSPCLKRTCKSCSQARAPRAAGRKRPTRATFGGDTAMRTLLNVATAMPRARIRPQCCGRDHSTLSNRKLSSRSLKAMDRRS